MKFEGEEIDGFTISVRAFKGPILKPLYLGEQFELSCMVEVVEVIVRENQKTGQIYRDHVVKIAEVSDD